MVECKDTAENLRTVLTPLREQMSRLKEMVWEGKKMELWLCGDYDFFTKMFGLSGPAGKHPCLYCHITKEDMKISPQDRTPSRPRTLRTLLEDHTDFVTAGSNKANAMFFNNCIELPIIMAYV